MRSLSIAVILLFISGIVWAGGPKNIQGQGQGQQQGQQQGQIGINKQQQGQIGINKQAQGQVGIQKAVGQGNTTNVNESEETEVYAPTWAPTPSTAGKQEQKAYSLWGGLDKNKLSIDVQTDHHIKTLQKMRQDGIIDNEQYLAKMNDVLAELERVNQPDKLLGFLAGPCDNVLVGLLLCW